jgi:hypothetical protein
MLTGGPEDVAFLARRFPRAGLEAVAMAIRTHGPRREDIERELARLAGTAGSKPAASGSSPTA